MKIAVDKIPEEGHPVEGKIEASEIALDMPGYGMSEPMAIAGRVTKVDRDVYLTATLRGALDSECSRCLTAFKMPLGLNLSVVYVPDKGRMEEKEGALESDFNVSFYEDDVIDILQDVKETIIINLPIKPVCRPDCKGLCPHCGADLNVADCGCEKAARGSPFEELKKLKSKLEEKQRKQS